MTTGNTPPVPSRPICTTIGPNMTQGKRLDDETVGLIKGHLHHHVAVAEISCLTGVSRRAIATIRDKRRSTTPRKKSGRPPKFSAQDNRAVLRATSETGQIARNVHDSLDLPVGIRRVQQLMAACDYLEYRKADLQHNMTAAHKKKRFEWAAEHVGWSLSQWAKVIFSDEKNATVMARTTSGFIDLTCLGSWMIFQRSRTAGRCDDLESLFGV